MFQITAYYRGPRDPARFDQHYATVHADLVRELPGLRHATINWPRPTNDSEPAPFHLVTVLYFDDQQAGLAALAGPEGTAAADDAARFECESTSLVLATTDVVIPFTRFPAGAEICGVLGLYERPADEQEFRAHYDHTHRALAARMPGQATFTVSWTTPGPDGTTPPFLLIGNQEWPTQADFDRCLTSSEAMAAVADLDNFVTAGVTILSSRTIVVM